MSRMLATRNPFTLIARVCMLHEVLEREEVDEKNEGNDDDGNEKRRLLVVLVTSP